MDTTEELINMIDRDKMTDSHFHHHPIPPTFVPFQIVAAQVTPGYWSIRYTKKMNRVRLSPAALGVKVGE